MQLLSVTMNNDNHKVKLLEYKITFQMLSVEISSQTIL